MDDDDATAAAVCEWSCGVRLDRVAAVPGQLNRLRNECDVHDGILPSW
jgi:hypothetical protein